MSLFHDLKEEGYTVKELADHLQEAVTAGEGNRTVMIGPTGGDDGNEPTAIRVIGIEANEDGETDVYWIYPGSENEF